MILKQTSKDIWRKIDNRQINGQFSLERSPYPCPPKNAQCWRNSNKNSPEKTTREIKTKNLDNRQKANSLQKVWEQ